MALIEKKALLARSFPTPEMFSSHDGISVRPGGRGGAGANASINGVSSLCKKRTDIILNLSFRINFVITGHPKLPPANKMIYYCIRRN